MITEDWRPGLALLRPNSPESTLTITPKDREDLVFRLHEPLVLRVEQATGEAQNYRVEVRRQREDGAAVWTAWAELPAKTTHAMTDVIYPCGHEGAFEYTVTDTSGVVVDGPWEFVVVDPTLLRQGSRLREAATAGQDGGQAPADPVLTDSVDCTAANEPAHQFRDNGTSKVVDSAVGRYRTTGTAPVRERAYLKKNGVWREAKPGEKGTQRFWALDWYAYTLHVKHPGRQHMVVAWVPNDVPRSVPVQVFDQVSGQFNGNSLCASNAPAAGAFSPLRIPMWPNGDVDVMVYTDGRQRGARYPGMDPAITEGAVARLELYEYPQGLPPLPEPAAGWGTHKDFGWIGEQWDLGMEQRMMPKLWKADDMLPAFFNPQHLWSDGFYDWKALRETWERYGQFARWRGENLLSVPVYTYGNTRMINTPHFPVFFEAFSIGYRARVVDPFFRDQFKLMLLLAQKYGYRMVADVMVDLLKPQGAEYLEAFDPSWKGRLDGAFLTGLDGKPAPGFAGCAFNPAHPVARRYFLAMAEDVARQYGKYPAFGGIRTRQWSPCALGFDGWFSSLDTAYDDFTVNLFEQETGVRVPVKADDPKRLQLRHDWLLANARDKWVQWRCDKTMSLREELLATVRKYAPQARLYGAAVFSEKPRAEALLPCGVDYAKIKGRPELGWSGFRDFGGDGVEYSWVDPTEFRNFDRRLPENRRPSLQQILEAGGGSYPQNLYSGARGAFRGYPYDLEEPARILANEKLDTITYGGCWVTPQAEEGLRRFIQIWRAIPDRDYAPVASPTRATDAVVGWQARSDFGVWPFKRRATVFYLVNRTDSTQQAKVTFAGSASKIRDLVTGRTVGAGQQVEVALPPYMLQVMSATGAKSIQTIGASDVSPRQ